MELWDGHFVLGSDNRSGSWHCDDRIIIFPLYLPLCCTGGEVHKCKVKCPSWLNTSFIVGHVDWGRVQHGLEFWEVCSFGNNHVNLQPSPANTILQDLPSSRYSYRKLHPGLLHDRMWGEQPTVCWLEQLSQFHFKIDCVRLCFWFVAADHGLLFQNLEKQKRRWFC